MYDLLIRHGGQVSDLKAMSCDSIADFGLQIFAVSLIGLLNCRSAIADLNLPLNKA